MTRVLICDDDASVRLALARILNGMDCHVVTAEDGLEAQAKLAAGEFDLVITDLRMPKADGFAVLQSTRELNPLPPVIILTGHGSIADCVRAMRAGAVDFIGKPFDPRHLEQVVSDVVGGIKPSQRTGSRVAQAALVGDSPQFLSLLRQVEVVAGADGPVLLVGERSTGKRTIARLLHASSERAGKPFIVVNCDDMSLEQLRAKTSSAPSDLDKPEDGTLLFAAVGPVDTIDAVELSQVFAAHARSDANMRARIVVDVDVDPEREEPAGALVSALQEALGATVITVPALRERAQDVPLLGEYFLEAANRRLGRRVDARALLSALKQYPWPGNLDELETRITQYVSHAPPDHIDEKATSVNVLIVPIDRVDATLILHDGTRREVVLPSSSGQRVDTLFDSGEPFIAVKDGGETRIYARSALACVTVREERADEDDALPENRRLVRVQLRSGASVDGELRYVAVEGRSRVSDALNEPTPAFCVHAGAAVHHVAKAHVAFVEEL